MGHMATALAHELEAPLEMIEDHLDAVASASRRGQRQKALDLCVSEIRSLIEVIERVLNLAQPTADLPSVASVPELVDRALSLVGKSLERAGLQVDADLADVLPLVRVEPDQMLQVLLNLLLNTIEALPDGGHVRITAQADGEMVALTLTNDGPPIPEEHVERVFEPFFTTKPEGTGLGLFIGRNVVEQHGGRLQVENLSDGQGVSFTALLPAASEEQAPEESAA